MQRLIEAAKAVVDYFEGEYWCIDVLSEAISDVEQQASDDAEVVTEWWFNNHFGGHVQLTDLRFISWDSDGLKLYCEDGIILLNDTKTCGQLRRLIAALKGGEQ